MVSIRAQYSASVLERAIMVYFLLFQGSEKNQEENNNQCRPLIGGISCPISIIECIENIRRLGKVEKATKKNAFQVSKNAQDSNIMSRLWNKHKLAQLVNNIRNF